MKRHVKLVAAVVVVLMSLSGFSVNKSSGGRGSSSSGGKSSGGGGCSSKKSSSHSSNSGSRSSTSSGSGSSNSSRNQPPKGTVVECAADTAGRPSSTVRVTSRSSSFRTYTVEVDFLGEDGRVVDTGTARAGVGGKVSQSVVVRMKRPSLVSQVDDCRLTSVR